MVSIPSMNSAALQILRQDRLPSASSDEKQSVGAQMIATANGVDRSPEHTRAKMASDIFSVNHVDANQLKVRLMERLGNEFGISRGDYDSPASYGAALRFIVSELKQQPGGHQVLAGIEKNLGLDELGISIDALINAVIDPQGNDGDKLDAALKNKTGEDTGDRMKSDASSTLTSIRFDEIGLYSAKT